MVFDVFVSCPKKRKPPTWCEKKLTSCSSTCCNYPPGLWDITFLCLIFVGHMFSKDFKNLMTGNNSFRYKMFACLVQRTFSLREKMLGGISRYLKKRTQQGNDETFSWSQGRDWKRFCSYWRSPASVTLTGRNVGPVTVNDILYTSSKPPAYLAKDDIYGLLYWNSTY